jgi:hypothetical protein
MPSSTEALNGLRMEGWKGFGEFSKGLLDGHSRITDLPVDE